MLLLNGDFSFSDLDFFSLSDDSPAASDPSRPRRCHSSSSRAHTHRRKGKRRE